MEEPNRHCEVERRHGDDHSRQLAPYQRALGGVQGLPGPAGRGGSLERAVQLLIEELNAAALVRALGLEQRVFARPLGEAAGPSEQPQGRERPRPPTLRVSSEAMPARPEGR